MTFKLLYIYINEYLHVNKALISHTIKHVLTLPVSILNSSKSVLQYNINTIMYIFNVST